MIHTSEDNDDVDENYDNNQEDEDDYDNNDGDDVSNEAETQGPRRLRYKVSLLNRGTRRRNLLHTRLLFLVLQYSLFWLDWTPTSHSEYVLANPVP